MIAMGLVFLAGHFFLYAMVLRHWPALKTERGIFLYHALFAAFVFTVAAVGSLILQWENSAAVVVLLALQGIYSLSFLELWSLTQGGYSIRILNAIERAREGGVVPDLACCEDFGKGKTVQRLEGLSKLGLVRRSGAEWELTYPGKMCATALRVVVRLVNHKSIG